MRHMYIRLILGILWFAAMVVSIMKANSSFAALYAVLAIVFLWSAWDVWKKKRDKEDAGQRLEN